MKKLFEGIGALIGLIFAGGFMFLYIIVILGFTVFIFQTGFKTARSIVGQVVGVFSSDNELASSNKRNELVKKNKLNTEKNTSPADLVCSILNEQYEKYYKNDLQVDQLYSSVNCEIVDPDYVNMNYKLKMNIGPNLRYKIKMNFEKDMANDPQLKRICKMFYKDSGPLSRLQKFKLIYNIYENDDELLVFYEIDKNKCNPGQYATKQDQDLEM